MGNTVRSVSKSGRTIFLVLKVWLCHFSVPKVWSKRTAKMSLFVICSTLFMFTKLSSSFRVETELDSAMFHIETQQRFCGCEERESLKILQSQTEWTPEDFMTQHGKLWLGGVKSEQENTCAQMCLLVNQRTTHFTFEKDDKVNEPNNKMCHCYSDLHPFHCEEEEGVDLLPVNCIEHKKVPNSRPLLTMLSRSASTLKPKANDTPARHSGNVSKTQYHKDNFGDSKTRVNQVLEQKTTLAAASCVLIIMALCGLVCLMGKTCHEEKRKKKNSLNRLVNSETPSVSTTSISSIAVD